MIARNIRRAALLLLLAAPVIAATPKPPAKPAARAPAATDWTRTVTALPNGAFLLGNPAAKTRLIEYMSYSCSHCADFAGAGSSELKAGWVKRGLVAVEYRNFVRDGFDLTAALLVRCGGAARFLANHDAIYAGFDDWMAKAQGYADAHREAAANVGDAAQFAETAEGLGLTALVARQGVTPAAQRQCLADKTALSTILSLTAGAWDADPDFEGTPTFIVNGKVARGVHSWPSLKPLLPPLPGQSN